jgi:hypothetical protein
MHFFDIASDRFNSSYKRIKIRLQKEYRLQFPPDYCVWSGLYQIASPNKILAESRVSEIVSRGPIVGVCYGHSFTRLWIAHLCEKHLSCKVLSELQLSLLHRFVAQPHDPPLRLSGFGPTITSQLLLGCGVEFFPSWHHGPIELRKRNRKPDYARRRDGFCTFSRCRHLPPDALAGVGKIDHRRRYWIEDRRDGKRPPIKRRALLRRKVVAVIVLRSHAGYRVI